MASADRGLPEGGAAHLVRATGRAGRVRIRSPGKHSATGETCRHAARSTETQKAHPAGWAFYLFDAWQFMAGVLPATLRAVAAQRSNPLPADLSSSGERSPTDNRQNKKLSLSTELSALFDAWQFPTLTWGDPTLPSALRRFTSEFGMGSGGTTALSPPGKFCFQHVSRTHRVICIRAENSLNSAKTASAL